MRTDNIKVIKQLAFKKSLPKNMLKKLFIITTNTLKNKNIYILKFDKGTEVEYSILEAPDSINGLVADLKVIAGDIKGLYVYTFCSYCQEILQSKIVKYKPYKGYTGNHFKNVKKHPLKEDIFTEVDKYLIPDLNNIVLSYCQLHKLEYY